MKSWQYQKHETRCVYYNMMNMNYRASNFGPNSTPSTIRRLILWTCTLTILSAVIQSIFDQFLIAPGPEQLLGLSWWGISKGFLWQPITYLFIQQSAVGGISFNFLISLFFNMYLFWIIGSSLIEMLGRNTFLGLYFTIGIAAGLLALCTMLITGSYTEIAGVTPVMLSLLIIWSMAFPEAEIFLFFLIPIKAKWLVAMIIGAFLLINLSHMDITNFALYFSAIAIGYAYACLAWGWHSPFAFTQKFDCWLAKCGLFLRGRLPSFSFLKKPSSKAGKATIIDLNNRPLHDDEAFVDAMLAKISKYGEKALSISEKQRLKNISESKLKDKK